MVDLPGQHFLLFERLLQSDLALNDPQGRAGERGQIDHDALMFGIEVLPLVGNHPSVPIGSWPRAISGTSKTSGIVMLASAIQP